MNFFCLKPVVAGAVEAAEPDSADLLSTLLSTSNSSATFSFGLTQPQTISSPHTSPAL